MESEIITGPTPCGGDYCVVMFKDSDGNPTEKESAVGYEIQEYQNNGVLLQTSYTRVDRS